MDRQRILANVSSLTAEQLFDQIKQQNVTLDDLRATGNLDATKRTKILDLQKQLDSEDDEAWERARYGNEIELSEYIRNNPSGKHVQAAKDKIRFWENARSEQHAKKQGIIDAIRYNPNSFSPEQINDFLREGTISKADLSNCGIPNTIIEAIQIIHPPNLDLGVTPHSIPTGYTEVYFWGIPGSGKTCALSAIFSAAHKAGYLNIATGPGYDYMTRLKNIFVDDHAILPPPSPLETTQYLPFALKKADENYARSISLIELSGEIFQCFYYQNAGRTLPSQSHQDTFDSLNRFLKGENRKIHFFFIDYSKGNKTDSSGYTQSDYLEAASTYFKNNAVFGKSTDAIYVVLTKCDLMPGDNKNERLSKAREHLGKDNFTSFMNILKDNCNKYSINAGRLTIEPFSLGKVYFQSICDFDPSSANKIIDILLARVPQNKKSILDFFNK